MCVCACAIYSGLAYYTPRELNGIRSCFLIARDNEERVEYIYIGIYTVFMRESNIVIYTERR